MIYVDTSVALAHLLSEDRRPPDEMWVEDLVTTRLLQYEVWNRIHGRDLERSHGDHVHRMLARFAWLELQPSVLARALRPYPIPVRTLDALHLAGALFLQEGGRQVQLATYDRRMADAAVATGLSLYPL